MKKDIIKRLLEKGQIDFDEALVLMETEKEYIYYPPYYTTVPYIQTDPTITTPHTYTDTTGNSFEVN